MNTKKIAVIGQGYVGLPLAIEKSKKYRTYRIFRRYCNFNR